MRTLVACGYVRQQANRRYALGPRLIRLGESASRLLGTWARPYLARLVEETGETANMALLDGDEIVYVAQVPSKHSMRMFTEVGRRVLPHSTGVGKALLAGVPDDEVRALLARTGMPAATEKTITTPDGFLAALADGTAAGLRRRRQRAGDRGAVPRGVRARLPTAAAISISGPAGRVTEAATEKDRAGAPADRRRTVGRAGQPEPRMTGLQNWPGRYTDRHGREDVVFASDGRARIRTTIRGVPFEGDGMGRPRRPSAGSRRRGCSPFFDGALCSCLLEWELPPPVETLGRGCGPGRCTAHCGSATRPDPGAAWTRRRWTSRCGSTGVTTPRRAATTTSRTRCTTSSAACRRASGCGRAWPVPGPTTTRPATV